MHIKTELLSNVRLDRFASWSCGRSQIMRQFCPRPVECAEVEDETKKAFDLKIYKLKYHSKFPILW